MSTFVDECDVGVIEPMNENMLRELTLRSPGEKISTRLRDVYADVCITKFTPFISSSFSGPFFAEAIEWKDDMACVFVI